MAQQTRLQTMIPYYLRWMKSFPTIKSLAFATEQDVLKAWEGLGYYSRARNLQKSARILVEKYKARLPQETRLLRELPGIGAYSAAAIASLAFGRDEAALDGNIRRVLARVFSISKPLGSSACEKELLRLAKLNLPRGKAGDYNQALMDLGSVVCLPRNPDCPRCPLAEICLSRRENRQNSLPVRMKVSSLPNVVVTAAIIHHHGKVLISRRPSSGLLGGMWEFPGGKLEPRESLEACLQREIMEELGSPLLILEPLGVFHHSYSHFRVELHAFKCSLNGIQPKPLQVESIRWVKLHELEEFPMGKIDRMIARKLSSKESLDES
jgi:A/G-specific adenine glycosylase